MLIVFFTILYLDPDYYSHIYDYYSESEGTGDDRGLGGEGSGKKDTNICLPSLLFTKYAMHDLLLTTLLIVPIILLLF